MTVEVGKKYRVYNTTMGGVQFFEGPATVLDIRDQFQNGSAVLCRVRFSDGGEVMRYVEPANIITKESKK